MSASQTPTGWFDHVSKRDHEGVFFLNDNDTGLRAIIAIHNTTLGPALGGCRIKHYQRDEDGLIDVLRLSRAMTYKASAAGLNLGGGKSVILLREGQEKTPELLAEFAKRVELLQGSYITAGDIGSTTTDLKLMRSFTNHVVGLAKEDGGLGDSAILTSLGVFRGLQAAVKAQLDKDNLEGLTVGIQGAGKVGYHLMDYLLKAGCKVIATDPNTQSIQRVQQDFPEVTICDGDSFYDQPMDVFSPNAIGGLINDDVVKRLNAKVLAGGANNPLAHEGIAQQLHDKGILYAPDFVINAGGLIMVASEISSHTFEQAKDRVEGIYDKTLAVFEFANTHQLLPWEAARQMAMNRISQSQHLTKEAVNRTRSMFAEENTPQVKHSKL